MIRALAGIFGEAMKAMCRELEIVTVPDILIYWGKIEGNVEVFQSNTGALSAAYGTFPGRIL